MFWSAPLRYHAEFEEAPRSNQSGTDARIGSEEAEAMPREAVGLK